VVQAVVFGCVSGGAGDNQATNHNRTKERGENQSMGKTVTTPTAAVLAAPPPLAAPLCHPLLPPPFATADAVERPSVHVKRRQLEKCRDSAAV